MRFSRRRSGRECFRSVMHDMVLGLKTRDEKLGLEALGTHFKLVNQVLDEDRVDSFPGEGQE